MIAYKVILSLKSKNVVKFYVHISPVFSCRVTYMVTPWIKEVCVALTTPLSNWQGT